MSRCMCGDIYCPSCGPAQGNSKCPACGRWNADQFYYCTDCDRVFEDDGTWQEDNRCDKCGHPLEERYGCHNPKACEAICDAEDQALAEEMEAAEEYAKELEEYSRRSREQT